MSVHSGGRHCLALSADGEVFSWGEGDDGKLGHGNRVYVYISQFIYYSKFTILYSFLEI